MYPGKASKCHLPAGLYLLLYRPVLLAMETDIALPANLCVAWLAKGLPEEMHVWGSAKPNLKPGGRRPIWPQLPLYMCSLNRRGMHTEAGTRGTRLRLPVLAV